MDKLTAIKIKYDDGTYSDEIPVSVLSENVEWDSTHTLVDVLGSINVDVTGTIQDQISQLFNEKVSNSQMVNYVSTNMNTYITDWLNTNVNPMGSAVVVDKSLTVLGAAADAKVTGDKITDLKSDLSESTRNINTSKMGRYRNQSNGLIFDADEHCYGMETFISVKPNTAYIMSVGGLEVPSGTYAMVLEVDENGNVSNYAGGYIDYNFRRVITKATTAKLHIYIRNDTAILDITSAWMQIEEGDKVTEHISPVTATDFYAREETDRLSSAFLVHKYIDNTKDLNDIAENGSYRWNESSVPVNAPTRVQARLLHYETDNEDGIGNMQIVINKINELFIRYYTYGGYSEWTQFVNKDYVDNKIDSLLIKENENWR